MGWTNWETQNVGEWLQNDECLYNAMVQYAQETSEPTYQGFLEWMGLEGETSDGVRWDDHQLDHDELDELFNMEELEEDMTPAEKLVYAVDGAEYCYYDEIAKTLIVWSGRETFWVFSVESGELIAMWISDNQLGLNDEAWTDHGSRLQAAQDRIRFVTSCNFVTANGQHYLEAYSVIEED